MSPLETLDINQLPEKEHKNYKDINRLSSKDELSHKLNDRLFQSLENGTAMIERHDGDLIFKQKDINATSLIDRKGQTFEGKAFRVKESTLKRYLKAEQTKEGISSLQKQQLDKLAASLGVKTKLGGLQEEVILTKDAEELSTNIDSLINWLESHKKRPKSPKLFESKNTKKRYKQVIKDDISLLKSIKRELNNYNYANNVDYFVDKVKKIDSHKYQLEKIRQIIASGNNTAQIPAILDSMKDVEKEAVFQNIAASYNIEYNSILKNATMTKLFNKDLEGLQEYLQKVWSGEIEHPEQDKFYAKYKKDFEEIKKQDPNLYVKITQNRKTQRNNNSASNDNYHTEDYNKKQEEQIDRCEKGKGAFDKGGELFVDGLDKLGRIDKNNPKQVEAVKKLGKYAMIGTAIFLGFKFIGKLFSKKGTKNKRRDTALFGGGLFALLNFDKVTKWGGDLFNIGGKKKTIDTQTIADKTKTDVETVETHITPQFTTMAAIGGVPINILIAQKLLTNNSGKLGIDYKKYKLYIASSDLAKEAKETALLNLKKLEEDGTLLTTCLDSFGIETLDDMKKIAGSDDKKTLLDSNKATDYIEDITSGVNADLAKEGLKPKDAKAWYEVTQEYKNSDNDAQIVKWMKKGLLEFDGSKPPYKLEDMLKNPNLDLKNKTMKGLDIKFDSYEDLFGAVDLTKFIKNTFKAKPANDIDPFHVSLIGNIQFDNKDRWNIAGDTDIINANPYKNTLKKISAKLDDKKDKYVGFLNKRHREILLA